MSQVIEVAYAPPKAITAKLEQVAWREVVIFSLLAYAISWTWLGIRSLSQLFDLVGRSTTAEDPTRVFGSTTVVAVSMFGPLIAAVVMRLFVSREGIRSSMRLWRGPRPYLVALAAFFAPGVFMAVVVVLCGLMGIDTPNWSAGDSLSVLSPLLEPMLTAGLVGGFISLVANVVFAYGEEYGWRGYLLPRLLPLGEVRGTLILALIWAGWHFPILIGGVDYPAQNLWLACAVFTFVTCGLAFPFTWFFRMSGGSVIVVSILHTSLNSYWDSVLPTLLPSAPVLLVGLAMGVVLTALALVVYGLRANTSRAG